MPRNGLLTTARDQVYLTCVLPSPQPRRGKGEGEVCPVPSDSDSQSSASSWPPACGLGSAAVLFAPCGIKEPRHDYGQCSFARQAGHPFPSHPWEERNPELWSGPSSHWHLYPAGSPAPRPCTCSSQGDDAFSAVSLPAALRTVFLITACWQPLSSAGRWSAVRGHMQLCWGWPLSVAWNGQLAAGTDLGLCWPPPTGRGRFQST